MQLVKNTLEKDDISLFHTRVTKKDFAFIIFSHPEGILHISAFNKNKTKETLKEYQDYFLKNENWNGITDKEIDSMIADKNYFFHNQHLLMLEEIENAKSFRKKVYIGALKSTSYIQNIQFIMNSLLLIVMLTLMGLEVYLVSFATDKVLFAVKQLNQFAEEAYKPSKPDLSKKFNKSYGNVEVDKLVVTLNTFIGNIDENIKKIEDFSSNVSHELKTPLASIKSMIEIELINDRDPEEYQQVLIKILEEINWLITMTNSLLNLHKDPEAIRSNFQLINMQELCLDICELMDLTASDQGIDLQVNLDEISYLRILGDSGSIRQILINIINNAIKYNKPEGWIKVTGTIFQGEFLLIVIEDSGIGIKRENIKKITNRFFREDSVRTSGKNGAGLGLSLVKHLLYIHNAQMVVKSVEGKGSKFKLYFKLYNEDLLK